MPPRVTVILSTYNWSTVLPYSIGSVLGQTMTDFELLVVGDGCTDDSEQVVAAISDPRIQWINLHPRSGHQSGPNNEGIRQARSPIVAYLGHDDLWLPHHLAFLISAIERGADLAYSVTALVQPDGFVCPAAPDPRTGSFIPPSSVMHRRELAERLGGWQDYRELKIDPEAALWQKALAAGFHFEFVPRLTVIKFPASRRRGVYRNRPNHEQAAWFERIRTEPDLEVVELGRMAASSRDVDHIPYRELLKSFVRQTGAQLRRRLARPSEYFRLRGVRKGARVREAQQFKGLG